MERRKRREHQGRENNKGAFHARHGFSGPVFDLEING
jgi:hypothetical protein